MIYLKLVGLSQILSKGEVDVYVYLINKGTLKHRKTNHQALFYIFLKVLVSFGDD